MSRRAIWGIFLFLTAAILPRASGQTLYGSLVGNITDPAGAAIPQAKVRAMNSDTSFAREVTADERGSFLFSDLQAGRYEVTVTHPSFASFMQRDVQVSNNAVMRMDVRLQLASSTDKVTVVASVSAL